MSEEKIVAREDLVAKVVIGSAIHVLGGNGQLKYRANVAGYDSGILITSMPSAKQLQIEEVVYSDIFIENMTLLMRLIVDGTIYAFKSEVRAVNLKPCKILMSSLPKNIQTRKLRQGVRYPCMLQAGVVLGETKYRGILLNLSEGGCLFRMKATTKVAAIKALIEKGITSSLNVRFPFEENNSSFLVKIKSVKEESSGDLLVGISYAEKEASDVIKKYFDFMQLEELSEYLSLN
jgi:hypothetical protein